MSRAVHVVTTGFVLISQNASVDIHKHNINTMETTDSQVPQIHLNFDQTKQRMDSFLARFDDHVNDARQKIITERNDFSRTMSENKETAKGLNAQIEELKQREQEISEARAKDQQELAQSRSAIAAHVSKRDEAQKANDHLVAQIDDIREKIQQRRQELAAQKQSLTNQTSLNKPELDFWERTLGLRIEGQAEDFIKFIFTQVDNNDVDKEYSFVVDLREHDYAVSECSPQIPNEALQKSVDELNETRALSTFLRDMRRHFKNL